MVLPITRKMECQIDRDKCELDSLSIQTNINTQVK